MNSASAWMAAAAFVLMFFNWGIEARKWQLALSPVHTITFPVACRAIFTGTTLAFFTPNRIGEYMGRIMHLEEGKRISSIALTIVCSLAQLMITITAGIAGIYFIRDRLEAAEGPRIIFWINLFLTGVCGVWIVLTIFYFRISWLMKKIETIRGIEKYLTYISVLDRFNATLLLRILSLSAGRFLIFILQYALLFSAFGVNMEWWQTFWSVSVVFLVIAVIPSIALLTELGVRWEASLEVIRLFSPNMAGILAASLAVWVINLVIPALIGSLLIPRLKFFRK